jgi:hypothetical protein
VQATAVRPKVDLGPEGRVSAPTCFFIWNWLLLSEEKLDQLTTVAAQRGETHGQDIQGALTEASRAPWLWRPTARRAIAPDRSSLSWPLCLVPLQILDRTTFGWALESALAGRVSEKIPRLARLGLFFSWSRVESGVFYDVALSALVSVLAR